MAKQLMSTSTYRFLFIASLLVSTAIGGSAVGEVEADPQALLVLHDPKGGVRLDPVGHFNPVEGTAEFWFTIDFDPASVKTNQSLLEVRYGPDNSVGLYFNAQEKALVFYMRDADDPRDDHHSRDYPVFMNSGRLDWSKGDRHHVAVTWSPAVSRMYLDGQHHRRSFYRGGLIVEPASESKREMLISPGQFRVDAVRIWSVPRAPRQIDRRPRQNETDELVFPRARPVWPASAQQVSSGRLLVGLDDQNRPVGLAIDSTDQNWMWRPAHIDVDRQLNHAWTVRRQSDAVVLTIELTNPTPDTITTDLTATFPILQPDMEVFFPAGGCPFPLQQGRLNYGRSRRATPTDSKLPLVTLYQPGTDRGLTLTPGDRVYEDVIFDAAMEGKATELSVTHRDLVVPAGETRTVSWYLVGHEADWRPGLGAYARLFPDILRAPQGPIVDGPQSMIIGGPSTEEFLTTLRQLDVGWREVTLYLGEGAGFGNYIPDDIERYQKAVDSYRRDIVRMNTYDVQPLMYVQARECKDVQRAVTQFADSVQRRADGEPVVDAFGPFGASMNCEPGSTWFAHIENQARRILSVFPDSKGLFFDNAWETRYADIMKAAADVAHAQGKSLASNGANAISVGWTDSIMAESATEALDTLRYLGLVTPVTYVPIYGTGIIEHDEREHAAPGLRENLFTDLRHCLISGAFYSFNYRGVRYWPEESLDLYRRYLPLQKSLRGRKWLLHAHALTLPKGLDGNIFEQPDGDWIVVLAGPADDLDGVVRLGDEVRVGLLPDRGKVASVTLTDLAEAGAQPVDVVVQDGVARLRIDEFHGLAVITLSFE